jgi:hypothetical protein
LSGPMERHLPWLALTLNGDPGSTQILTQHYGAQSQTVSHLESSRPTPTIKSPQLSPSGLSKHLRTGSVHMPHHNLTSQTELWGFIKSSLQNKLVHMELSLRQSFYLRHSLGGYMVGTTAGFPIKIGEALAPQSHRRITWKCLQ